MDPLQPRDRFIESCKKLQERLKGKEAKWPPSSDAHCPTCGGDISFYLAGVFFSKHIEAIIKAMEFMG